VGDTYFCRYALKMRAVCEKVLAKLRTRRDVRVIWLQPSPLDCPLPLPVAGVFQVDDLLLGEAFEFPLSRHATYYPNQSSIGRGMRAHERGEGKKKTLSVMHGGYEIRGMGFQHMIAFEIQNHGQDGRATHTLRA
jgi:hypothetical protein